jgi:hypothetical protein
MTHQKNNIVDNQTIASLELLTKLFQAFVIGTTVMFFSIWAKSKTVMSSCSLWDNSSSRNSSFKVGKSDFYRFKILIHILDKPEDIFCIYSFHKKPCYFY